jgi:hypothetical protein
MLGLLPLPFTRTCVMRFRRVLGSNPFLCTGVLGTLLFSLGLALSLQPRDGGVGQAMFYVGRVLAAPVHLASNLLAPITDSWPNALDAGAAVLAGLLPYVATDALWRRWRARVRATASRTLRRAPAK